MVSLCLLSFAVLLSGCANSHGGLVFDVVGPAPAAVSVAGTALTNGTLVVYSAYEVGDNSGRRDPDSPAYSDYKIFSDDGKLLRDVHNDSGTLLQDPVPVSLQPGKYLVMARANKYGRVTIPIVIEPQRETVLHLEGGGNWPDKSSVNNTVRLPDGQIIGFKSVAGT